MVIVVKENSTDRRSLNECVRLLKMSDAKILGFVMTGVKESDGAYGRYKYKYKYGSSYGSKNEVED